MTLLAGALSFDDSRSAFETAELMARRAARYEGLAPRVVHRGVEFSLFVVDRVADQPEPVTLQSESGESLCIMGDINYAAKPLRDRVARSNSPALLHGLDIPGRWVGLQFDSASQVLHVATDTFGSHWLYLAVVPGGVIFCSDFGALAETLRSALSLDIEAALFELCLGFLPAERTLYREISIAPPGAVLELGRHGIKEASRRHPAYGDRQVGASREAKFQRLDEIFDQMFREVVKPGFGEDLVLSLSAGFDSRFCLAFLEKHDIAAAFCTFGHPDSNEVDRAQRLAKLSGRSSDTFHFAASAWESWRRSAQQLGMQGTVQWSGWAEAWFEFLRDHGRGVAIGYLGDHLTGKKLAFDGGDEWLRTWMGSKMDGGFVAPSPSFELLRPMARRFIEDGLADTLKSLLDGPSYALPHQRALHLNLYGRQRRRVAAQSNLISRHLTPVVPLFCNELMEFFMNVGEADLRAQRLYRAYGQDRFPALFFKDERRKHSIGARVVRKGQRLSKWLLTGEADRPRPIVIDRDRMINPNKVNIISLARKVAPLIDEHLDMDAFCLGVTHYGEPNGLPSGTILTLVNLCHLLDLYDGPQDLV